MDDLVRLTDMIGGDTEESGDMPLAVATVVNTRGSAYRRPGARMLIRRSLTVSGAVSAGCLERDIIAHCEGMQAGDKPFLLTYDGASPDELVFGLKLGCDGIVQILVEPFQSNEQKYERLRRELGPLLQNHGKVAAVTVFDCACDENDGQNVVGASIKTGLVLLDSASEHCLLEDLPSPVSETLRREARVALLEGDGQSIVIQQKVGGYFLSALIEIVVPVTSLSIFGSGQDVAPLVDMAKVLGWNVSVISSQEIDRLDLPQLSRKVQEKPGSAAVVISHDYERDKKVLQALLGGLSLPADAYPYIGVVGPKRRAEKLLAELALAGIVIGESELARLYSPVGLDIGAERPEEIALSILAEIKSVLAGHNGGLLREKQGPIHEPIKVKGKEPAQLSPGSGAIPLTCRLGDV